MDRWDTDRIDPYLVCAFEGTRRTFTIHETGVTVCKASDKPAHAWCQ